MRNLIKYLEEKKLSLDSVVTTKRYSDIYWKVLPPYAEVFIKPAYELVFDLEGLNAFIHHFLIEYEYSNNDAKKLCIESVIFPLYRLVTGRNYDTNYFHFLFI